MLKGMKEKLEETPETSRALHALTKRLLAFRDYLLFRGLHYTDIILVSVTAALLLVCWLFSMPVSEVFTSTAEITLGYSAKQDAQGLYYVIDGGHTRLL